MSLKMRIDYPNFGQLIYRVGNRLIYIISSLVFAFFLLLLCLMYFNSYEIICQNKSPNKAQGCMLRVSRLGFYKTITPLGQLLGTRIVFHPSTRRPGFSFNIDLITEKGTTPLFIRWDKYQNLLKSDKSIKQYLAMDSASVFKVPYFYSWDDLFMVSFMLVLIGAIIKNIFRPFLKLVIDKNKNAIIITKGNAYKSTTLQFELSDIQEILVLKKRTKPWIVFFLTKKQKRRVRGFKSSLILELKDSSKIALTPFYRFSLSPLGRTTKKINAFINNYAD